jgi:hypothetical protein
MADTIQHTRIFKVWRDRVLNDDVWEHGKIRQWCKAVHNLTFNGERSGFATNLTEPEAEQLVALWTDQYGDYGELSGPRVTDEQAALGRHWLATTGRRYGLENDHKPTDITHFTFVGGRTLEGGRWAYVTPIYVAWWPDGTWLRYWATPWQDHADMEWMWGHA